MHESHKRTLSGSIALSLALCAAAGNAQLAGADPGSVGFFAVGPAGLEIKGQSSGVAVREADQRIEIELPMGHFETGIDLRDQHLRKYMHVDEHPTAKLVVPRSALSFPADNAVSQGNARGTLWLNGKEHPLDFSYQAKRRGAEYQVQALATLDIRDHGIEVPCYLRICVEPQVKLKIKLSLKDE